MIYYHVIREIEKLEFDSDAEQKFFINFCEAYVLKNKKPCEHDFYVIRSETDDPFDNYESIKCKKCGLWTAR